MENKPNSDEDYIIIFVRLPTKLLMQLGRWVLVATSLYVLLHKQPKAGRQGSRPPCLGC